MLPWINATPLDQRRAFIAAYLASDDSIANLAHRFRVSRKTAHKFINRYELFGDAGLHDLPRAPHSNPRATDPDLAAMIVEAKKTNPILGPKKIIPNLRDDHPDLHWPAPTRGKRHPRPRGTRQQAPQALPRRPALRRPLRRRQRPQRLLAIDFKGWARTADGARVDPLTLIDADSRFLIACEGLPRPTLAYVLPVVERAFQERGLPNAIRSDNGPPFASARLGGLSAFAVHLVKLGITPERIAPGHPEQNGRLERFHRTLKEAVMSPPAPTLADQQRAFDAFRRVYNEDRPHEALGQRPPASRYAPSPRPYPGKVESPEYPAGVEVRRVRSNGEIKWAGGRVFVSEALVGEPVGLVRYDDRLWTVRFGHLEIGRLDGYALRIIKTPVRALPMYPG